MATKLDRMVDHLDQLKKKLYGPFLCIRFNYLKARVTSRSQFTFYHKINLILEAL